MATRRHITRSDAAILIVLVAFLLLNLAAVGQSGRERAKRVVCLSNLRQLTQAWRLYADDNDGKIVNGDAGNTTNRPNEPPWVGKCFANSYITGGQLPEDEQIVAIQRGALWPYTQELKLYRCPMRYPGEMLNYSVVDSMNGRARSGTSSLSRGTVIGSTVLWIKNLNEIISPSPAERSVLIDEGWITPDSFAVHYSSGQWWDGPPVRHNEGVNLTFADGHGEYWQWRGADTIRYGHDRELHLSSIGFAPETPEGRGDLQRLQRAVWGRLGYLSQ